MTDNPLKPYYQPSTFSTDVVMVRAVSDLPPLSADRTYIQLADYTPYCFDGTVRLPFGVRIRPGINNVICASSRRNGGIIGRTTTALISCEQNVEDLYFHDISITQEGTGDIIAHTVASNQACRMDRLRIYCNGGDIGAPAFDIFIMTNTIATGFANGVTVGAVTAITYQFLTSLLIQAEGAGGNAVIDLGTAVMGSFRMRDGTYQTDTAGFALKGLANGANLAASTGLAEISGCRHAGLGAALSGITSQDVGFSFSYCVGIPISAFIAMRVMESNTTPTDITVADTWTVIAGTSVLEVGAPRYASFGNHGFEYEDRRTGQAKLTVTCVISVAASTQSVGIFKNGSLTPMHASVLIFTGAGPRTLVFYVIDEDVNTGDTYDLKIQCVGGTVDPTVQAIHFLHELIM